VEVSYPNAMPGVTVRYSAISTGVKESLDLASASAPTTFTYTLATSSGLSVSATPQGGLKISVSGGSVAFALPAVVLTDAAGAQSFGGTMTAANTAAGTTVTVTADPAWVAAPGRAFPVSVDPSLTVAPTQDCHIVGGTTHQSTNYCPQDGTPIEIGGLSDGARRGLAQFDLSNVPDDATVLNADLALYRQPAFGTALTLDVRKLTQTWDTTATWVNRTATTAWTSAGGSVDGTVYDSTAVGTAAGYYHWYPTSLVQAWVNDPVTNNGLLLKAANEATAALARFEPASTTTGNPPQLAVTWSPVVGEQPYYSYTEHRLNDRSHLHINNGSGDLLVHASDIHINATGPALNVDRFYNSLRVNDGVLGARWRLSVGPDVRLDRYADNTFSYTAPSGTAYLLNPVSGGWRGNGVNGLLTGPDANGDYTLTFDKSQERYLFDNFGCTDGCGYLQTRDTDRNGNSLRYTYAARQLATIEHWRDGATARDLALTVNYNAAGYLSKITDANGSTTRSWLYAYSGDSLTSYTDPSGAITSYGYNTANDLTSITDPPQNGGARPTTTVGFTVGHKVDWIKYAKTTAGAVYQFDFAYSDPYVARCANGRPVPSGTAASTNVVNLSDPQGGTTTYCYDRSDRVTRVIDGVGNLRDKGYTTNSDVSSYTSANSQVFRLGHDTNSNLTSASSPSSGSGQTAATTYFDYKTTGAAGAGFLPSSSTDPQNNCSSYRYDAAGNMTDSYAGIAPTGTACNGGTSGVHNHLDYNADGSVRDFIDPNGNRTDYSFDADGSPSQVRQPGAVCSADASRNLCTDLTYDGLHRTKTATDGNGNKTTYGYDELDRITKLFFGGASACNAGNTNCVSYSYDAEGNLTSRVDAAGTTTYTYDLLNRPKTKNLPGGPTVTTAFDGAGNLVSYNDGEATATTYNYNAADQLTGVTDPAGTIGFSYTDTRLTGIDYPGTGNVAVSYGYTSAGQLRSISPNTTALPSFSYAYNAGTRDTTLKQSATENGVTTSYGHDGLNRLSSANAATGTDYSFGYDAASNLTRSVAGTATTTYAYSAANQRCWSFAGSATSACGTVPAGAITSDYDGAGNLTATSSGYALAYNSRNQATSITHPGSPAVPMSYADADNTERTSAGAADFVNGPLGVTARTVGAGTTYYTRAPSGQLLAERTPGGATYYYLIDGSSNVRTLFTKTATVAARYAYTPYGEEVAQAQPDAAVHDGNPWRFAAGYLDIEGFYHFGARYYNRGGNWAQQDSHSGQVANPNSVNRYLYAGGDPITNIDPTGHDVITDIFGAIDTAFTVFIYPSVLSIGLGVASIGFGAELGGYALAAGLLGGIPLIAAGIAIAVFGAYYYAS
jgi:RHS repeat-associated protein